MSESNTIYKKLSKISEILDNFRVIPRLLLAGYGFLVYKLYNWITSIPTYINEKCNEAMVEILIRSNIPIDKVHELSCTVDGVAGGPTLEQAALATTIIGLSTAIFGLYVNSKKSQPRRDLDEN